MKRMRWPVAVLTALMVATPVVADEMQDAMDRADALNLMMQINLQSSQARQMIGPLRSIQKLVDGYNNSQTQSLNQLSMTLQRARTSLIAGDELSDQTTAALDNYQDSRAAARKELYASVSQQMQLIASILTPEQNRYLDWTPPGAVGSAEALQERAKAQQVAMGRIQEAARLLDAVKHLDAFNFVTGRGPLVNDYLALYFQAGTQQFEQAYDITINYTDQARMLTEEQWQAQAMDLGAALVEQLGLMPQMAPGVQPGTIPWSQLFRVVTNPQTLVVVRGLAR